MSLAAVIAILLLLGPPPLLSELRLTRQKHRLPTPSRLPQKSFQLENDTLSAEIVYRDGSVFFNSLFNKKRDRDYITDNKGRLFFYTVGDYQNGKAINTRTVSSDGNTLTYVSSKQSDITMKRDKNDTVKVGTVTEIVLQDKKAGLEITLLLEIYDGKEVAKTDAIQKNKQGNEWVDKTYTLDITLPEGAAYLVIVNAAGQDRICDHILYVDARFS